MQPRFSFSVDSLLGRKTNEADIKSECLSGFTDLHDEDHRESEHHVDHDNEPSEDRLDMENDPHDSTQHYVKEESESDSELNVDEDDDIAEQDEEDPSPESSPRPLIPTPLLAGRPPFPGLAGLQDLIRPPWAQGPLSVPFSGVSPSMFDKGIAVWLFARSLVLCLAKVASHFPDARFAFKEKWKLYEISQLALI